MLGHSSPGSDLMDALARLQASLSDRYEIDRQIGAGGMATVYLARDVRHHRQVAIKLLNPELGAVLGPERFLTEIRVTANLQHPNLLPLFDSGEIDGQLFYVMPYVEGESLRARLDRERQLSVNESVRIGAAVASALDYAHRHGVVHRDLKPENILLHDGQPLVADFGIALAVSNAGGERVTQTGLSLGTPQYMSPEQATGERSIDARSDIYSLGAVIYEMLTGEPPHTGGTVQAIIARVVTDTPRDIRISRPSIPDHVADAVAKALEKVPADRFDNAREFGEALQGQRAVSGASTSVHRRASATAKTPRFSRAAIVTTALLALLAILTSIYAANQRRSLIAARNSAPVARFSVAIPGEISSDASLAVSPDGKTIVYSARTGDSVMLFARPLTDWDARIIPGTAGAVFPFFSPDGKWIGFSSAGRLQKVPLEGGRPTTLLEGFNPSFRSAWASDGRIYFGRSWIARGRLGISSISSNGGSVRTVTRSDSAKGEAHYTPGVIDGETLVFPVFGPRGEEDDFLAIGSVKTGEYTILKTPCSRLLGLVDSYAICVTNSALTAIKIDIRSRKADGDPISLNGKATRLGMLSAAGTMVDFEDISRTKLVVTDAGGRRTDVVPLVAHWRFPVLSKDESKLLAITGFITDPGNVAVVDLKNGSITKFTLEGAAVLDWSGDGKHIMYTRPNHADGKIWTTSVDGSSDIQSFSPALPQGTAFTGEFALTPDGKSALIGVGVGRNPDDIYIVRLDDPAHRTSVWRATRYIEAGPKISPDGKWVAFNSDEAASLDVFVASFEDPSRKIRVSTSGGVAPLWSRDSRHIFFQSNSALSVRQLQVVDFDPESFSVSSQRNYVSLSRTSLQLTANYAVLSDGRVIAAETVQQEVKLAVTLNWAADFRQQLQR